MPLDKGVQLDRYKKVQKYTEWYNSTIDKMVKMVWKCLKTRSASSPYRSKHCNTGPLVQ